MSYKCTSSDSLVSKSICFWIRFCLVAWIKDLVTCSSCSSPCPLVADGCGRGAVHLGEQQRWVWGRALAVSAASVFLFLPPQASVCSCCKRQVHRTHCHLLWAWLPSRTFNLPGSSPADDKHPPLRLFQGTRGPCGRVSVRIFFCRSTCPLKFKSSGQN